MKTFFVSDVYNEATGKGSTLQAALKDYHQADGNYSIPDLCFFEAEEIEVVLMKKETIVKVPTTVLNPKAKGSKK
jgi:hypothetical protein